MFGWEGLRPEGLNDLSMREVRQMLRDVAWREGKGQQVTRNWQKYRKVWYVEVKCKGRRRILVQLRDGTAALEVETGRWQGFRREERV